jgi:hypothetical protein
MKIYHFFLILFLPFVMTAQDSDTQPIYPGLGDFEISVFGASNFSFLSENGFTEADDSEAHSGAGISFQAEYYFSPHWSMKGRINLESKGSEFADDIRLDLYYLTVPAMASWHFGKKKRWYLHFGPYWGYLLGATLDDETVTDDFDRMDAGTDFGFGVRIPAGPKRKNWFVIESDSQSSFTSPFKGSADTDLTLIRSTIGVGFIF